MSCEYCESIRPIPYQYADGFSGYIEVMIEGKTLFVEVGIDELVIPINHCPMCGADLRKEVGE